MADEIVEAEVVAETAMVKRASTGVGELSVEDVVAQVQKIQDVMTKAMTDGEHFGVIPGTDKPTLLKPGAEKLCLTFRLDPEYVLSEVREESGHYTVTATCTLWHIPTGDRIASGIGLCSTHESKYAYRKASRTCPTCSEPAIIRGKAEFGGGWVCWKRRGGCGASFTETEPSIVSQPEGRVANEDLADSWNTVLKMATKRALVAAVLNGTAASDIFTQDVEDSAPPVVRTKATDDQRATIEALTSGLGEGQRGRLNAWFRTTLWKMADLTEEQASMVIAKLSELGGGVVEKGGERDEAAGEDPGSGEVTGTSDPAALVVPVGTVEEVLAWVGDSTERAVMAWDAEVLRMGGVRKGVETGLEPLLGEPAQASQDAAKARESGRCISCGHDDRGALNEAGYCAGCEPFN